MSDEQFIFEPELIPLAKEFIELYKIIKKLRAPDGCPWDREQTPSTLISSLIEETFESADAIANNDTENIREELGDILMVVVMISVIHEEVSLFTTLQVISEINTKLIRRHPHVFDNIQLHNSDEVIRQWESIKQNVEKKDKPGSILSSVPKGISPYERAYLLQKKAAKNGFDWKDPSDVFSKVTEEIGELEKSKNIAERQEEIGDLIFSMINLCRLYKIDPSLALHRTNDKFVSRFSWVEKRMNETGNAFPSDNLELMDSFWNEKKEREKNGIKDQE